MSGGGNSGGSTTTIQKSDPWDEQRPYLKDVFLRADAMYGKGQLAPLYYPNQTVAGQDPYTSKAINLQASRALAGSAAVKSAQSQLDQTMKGQYLNNNPFTSPDTSPSFLTQYAKESTSPSILGTYAKESTSPSFLTGYQADSGSPAALQTWKSGAGNPELDNMVKRAQSQTLAQVNSNFAQSGRYGSGAQAAAAGDAAGNIATEMYGQAYDQDQNRSLQAWDADQARRAQAYDAAQNRGLAGWQTSQQNKLSAYSDAQNRNLAGYQTDQQNKLSAYDAAQNRNLTGWQTGQQNQLSAWDSALNRELSAYNAERENQMRGMMFAPSLAAEDYKDIAALSEAGTAKENYSQDLINAAIERYNYNAARPLTNLQNFAALVSGNYGMSGTSTASASAGRSNRLGNILGGAASGGGLGYLLGGATGGTGALIGAGLGGLLGLF